MPRLLYINERFGTYATIVLDSGEACLISVGRKGRIGTLSQTKLWGGLLASLLGPKLYEEQDVYRALTVAEAPVRQIARRASC